MNARCFFILIGAFSFASIFLIQTCKSREEKEVHEEPIQSKSKEDEFSEILSSVGYWIAKEKGKDSSPGKVFLFKDNGPLSGNVNRRLAYGKNNERYSWMFGNDGDSFGFTHQSGKSALFKVIEINKERFIVGPKETDTLRRFVFSAKPGKYFDIDGEESSPERWYAQQKELSEKARVTTEYLKDEVDAIEEELLDAIDDLKEEDTRCFFEDTTREIKKLGLLREKVDGEPEREFLLGDVREGYWEELSQEITRKEEEANLHVQMLNAKMFLIKHGPWTGKGTDPKGSERESISFDWDGTLIQSLPARQEDGDGEKKHSEITGRLLVDAKILPFRQEGPEEQLLEFNGHYYTIYWDAGKKTFSGHLIEPRKGTSPEDVRKTIEYTSAPQRQ